MSQSSPNTVQHPVKRSSSTDIDELEGVPDIKRISTPLTTVFEIEARPEDAYILFILSSHSQSDYNDQPFVKHWIPTSDITDEQWMYLNFVDGQCFSSEYECLPEWTQQDVKRMKQAEKFILNPKSLVKFKVAWNFKIPQAHLTMCCSSMD